MLLIYSDTECLNFHQLTDSENATESEREPMLIDNDPVPPVPTPSSSSLPTSPPPSYSPSTTDHESPSGNHLITYIIHDQFHIWSDLWGLQLYLISWENMVNHCCHRYHQCRWYASSIWHCCKTTNLWRSWDDQTLWIKRKYFTLLTFVACNLDP